MTFGIPWAGADRDRHDHRIHAARPQLRRRYPGYPVFTGIAGRLARDLDVGMSVQHQDAVVKRPGGGASVCCIRGHALAFRRRLRAGREQDQHGGEA